MENGSLYALDLKSNDEYFHFIKGENNKSYPKNKYDNVRISLTFRNIGTYISRNYDLYG